MVLRHSRIAFVCTACFALSLFAQSLCAEPLVVRRDELGRLLEPQKLFFQMNPSVKTQNGTIPTPDQWDGLGRAQLHNAAQRGDAELTAELLRQGARVDLRDAGGLTPLMHAVRFTKDSACVAVLLRNKADANSVANGMTALDMAEKAGNDQAVAKIRAAGGKTAAQIAPGQSAKAVEKKPVKLYLAWDEAELVDTIVKSPNPEAAADKSLRGSILLQRPAAKLEAMITAGAKVDGDDVVEPPLLTALQHKQDDAVRLLLKYKANPNAADRYGVTALHVACVWSPGMVSLLLEAGASASAKDKKGYTSLHAAAKAGRVELIPLLVQKGALVNDAAEQGDTPLHVAVSVEMLKALLAQGADVRAVNFRGENVYESLPSRLREENKTLLPELLRGGLPDANVYLVEALAADDAELFYAALDALKADGKLPKLVGRRRARQDEKNSPLSFALSKGNAAFTRALLKAGADPNNSSCLRNKYFLTIEGKRVACSEDIVADALDCGHVDMAIALIEGGAGVNNVVNDPTLEKPLHIAVRKKETTALKALLAAKGIKVDAKDRSGETPLFFAADRNFTEGMLLLLQAGADPNAANDGKYDIRLTPFTKLLGKGNTEAVAAFIKAGADVNGKKLALLPKPKNNFGQTTEHTPPVFFAVEGGHTEEVKLLLDAGAKVDGKDDRGCGILYSAAEKGDAGLFKLLADTGIDPKKNDSPECIPLIAAAWHGNIPAMEFLVQSGVSLESTDPYGNTPLLAAAGRSQSAAAQWLLQAGATLTARDKYGNTALHELGSSTTHYGDGRGYNGVNKVKTAALLLKAGLAVDERDKNDATPLHVAARGRSPELVVFLLQQGAAVNAKDNEGRTPLHMATSETMALLLEARADVTAKDNKGQTPLHMATAKTIPLLLEAKADVNALDAEGKTPHDSSNSSIDLAILKKYGGKPARELAGQAGSL